MGRNDDVIIIDRLRKSFGATRALDGLDLRVPGGAVCGLLGPNGSGKTTAVRVLATLTRPDAGRALVAGFDVVARPGEVRRRIGLAGQDAAVDERLPGRVNLLMFGRLCGLRGPRLRASVDDLLERFMLTEAAHRLVKTYSGGMRRRLDLAASLLIAPAVLFLDEPTTGLDPHGRSEVWDAIRRLAASGTTVLLTTQYLEEADQLAGQIAVIDAGRVIAEGTPDELKRLIGGSDQLEIVVADPAEFPVAAALLARIDGQQPALDPNRRSLSVSLTRGFRTLATVTAEIERSAIQVEDVTLRRSTLDDVFLQLTRNRAEGAGTSA